jgi:hypothetical protein
MSAHPFSGSLPDQIASLEHGLSLLRQFSEQYPFLPSPWCASAIGPSIGYPADASAALRAALGEDGWTFEHSHAHKDVGGIRIECRVRQQTRPLSWQEVEA